MATLRPFRGVRPLPQYAAAVAAKPYDVLNSDEARAEAAGKPLSFLQHPCIADVAVESGNEVEHHKTHFLHSPTEMFQRKAVSEFMDCHDGKNDDDNQRNGIQRKNGPQRDKKRFPVQDGNYQSDDRYNPDHGCKAGSKAEAQSLFEVPEKPVRIESMELYGEQVSNRASPILFFAFQLSPAVGVIEQKQ